MQELLFIFFSFNKALSAFLIGVFAFIVFALFPKLLLINSLSELFCSDSISLFILLFIFDLSFLGVINFSELYKVCNVLSFKEGKLCL